MSKLKGQNFRIFVDGKAIACSTSCQLHIAANLEDGSTKDSTDDWQEQDCTGKSWDGSADALVAVDSADSNGKQAFDLTELIGQRLPITFEQTGGDKNRIAQTGGVRYSGYAWINDISLTAGNRANSTYTVQFAGDGALTKSTIAAAQS